MMADEDVEGFSEDEGDYEDEDEEGEVEEEPLPYDPENVAWMMQQMSLYQSKLALLSVELSKKGYGVMSLIPEKPGLICARSSREHPLHCRVYIEPEEGSKVVAPCRCKGSQKFISISALNQQRRKEPEKWKCCPTCQAPIDYTMYEQHMGQLYKPLSWILNHRRASRTVLGSIVTAGAWLTLYQLRWLFIRILVSGFVWERYHIFSRIVYIPLPLKILAAQVLRKHLSASFLVLEEHMRDYLTELESGILEQVVPETITAEEAELAEEYSSS